jgi:membrane-bound serine protease (ClpP class)
MAHNVYALHLFTTNYLAFGLIILGIALIIAEAFVSSFGILGLIGAIAFVVGAMMLIEGPSIGYEMPIYFIILLSLTVLAIVALIVILTWRSQHRPVVSGREAIIGFRGKLVQADKQNWIYIRGERWQCRSDYPMYEGEPVVVVDLEGLVCVVKPLQFLGKAT